MASASLISNKICFTELALAYVVSKLETYVSLVTTIIPCTLVQQEQHHYKKRVPSCVVIGPLLLPWTLHTGTCPCPCNLSPLENHWHKFRLSIILNSIRDKKMMKCLLQIDLKNSLQSFTILSNFLM